MEVFPEEAPNATDFSTSSIVNSSRNFFNSTSEQLNFFKTAQNSEGNPLVEETDLCIGKDTSKPVVFDFSMPSSNLCETPMELEKDNEQNSFNSSSNFNSITSILGENRKQFSPLMKTHVVDDEEENETEQEEEEEEEGEENCSEMGDDELKVDLSLDDESGSQSFPEK